MFLFGEKIRSSFVFVYYILVQPKVNMENGKDRIILVQPKVNIENGKDRIPFLTMLFGQS